MSFLTKKPIILEVDGVFGQLGDGDIINAGGTSWTTWTVNGRGLLFDDGTSTAPGAGSGSAFDLQSAYNNSINGPLGEAKIKLTTGKDLLIADDSDDNIFFRIDAETGKVTISGDLEVLGASTVIESVIQDSDHWLISPKNGITTALKIEPDFGVTPVVDLVSIRRQWGSTPVFRITASGDVVMTGQLTVGLINNVDINQLNDDFIRHVTGADLRHTADQIDIDPIPGLVATNVQQALEEIKTNCCNGPGGIGNVNGYEHIQSTDSQTWVVAHGGNTFRLQITVYDTDWEMIIPNSIKVMDNNTAIITFAAPISGRAMVLMF